jgi:hypothetical protein
VNRKDLFEKVQFMPCEITTVEHETPTCRHCSISSDLIEVLYVRRVRPVGMSWEIVCKCPLSDRGNVCSYAKEQKTRPDEAAEEWVAPLLQWKEDERGRRSLERRIRDAHLGGFKPLCDFD